MAVGHPDAPTQTTPWERQRRDASPSTASVAAGSRSHNYRPRRPGSPVGAATPRRQPLNRFIRGRKPLPQPPSAPHSRGRGNAATPAHQSHQSRQEAAPTNTAGAAPRGSGNAATPSPQSHQSRQEAAPTTTVRAAPALLWERQRRDAKPLNRISRGRKPLPQLPSAPPRLSCGSGNAATPAPQSLQSRQEAAPTNTAGAAAPRGSGNAATPAPTRQSKPDQKARPRVTLLRQKKAHIPRT